MKKINLSTGAKASIAYTLGSVLTKGIGVFTLPFFTNTLSQTEIGTSNIYVSWYAILFVIVNLSLCSAAYNIGLKDFKEERNSFTLSLVLMSFLSTSFFFVLYLVFRVPLNDLFTLPTNLLVVMFLSFFVDPAYNFWMARQRYELHYKRSVIVSIAYSILVAVSSVLAVYFLRNSEINLGEVKIVSSFGVTFLFGLVFTVLIFAKGLHKPTLKYWRYILPICLPLVVHSLAGQLLNVADRVMIAKMIGEDAVGVYSTLYNISSLALILWTAINGSLVPFMFDKLDDHESVKKELSPIVVPLLVIYGVFALSITLVAPELVLILTNSDYASAVYVVPPVAAGIFLTAVFNLFGNVLSYSKKTKFIMFCTLIAGISNVALNYWLIPMFGYVAAAYTTLFGYIELAFFSFLFAKISYRTPFVNVWFVVLVSVITVGLCLLCNLLYPYPILRYVVIGLAIVLSAIFSKKVIFLLRKIIKRQ